MYRIEFHDPEIGECYRWFASKREAQAEAAQMKRFAKREGMNDFAIYKVSAVEITTTVKGLLNLLNRDATVQDGAHAGVM